MTHMEHDETGRETMRYRLELEGRPRTEDVLRQVYLALKEKGYDPTGQLVGYLLSGDPAYITTYRDARKRIRALERDELLEEVVEHYLRRFAGETREV
ncbi:IreB family regulatory phosphoprotein [Limnochorda pilosa]|uniref:UPF0297 protein LIP_2617 n=1 Tax=Limnochorda pilosa TaxID=1555112 RepID=A0A0K2SN68_LIMPI|nr:IreB family regulatory phosphoprotein [Limnochorda pilosa]BAS28447.1 hypothetical protein LIP_2617 [Limnochorda pilosa]